MTFVSHSFLLYFRYYSATILQMAGIRDDKQAIWLTAATSGTNFVFTLVGVWLVERVGRRKLTLGSLFGMLLERRCGCLAWFADAECAERESKAWHESRVTMITHCIWEMLSCHSTNTQLGMFKMKLLLTISGKFKGVKTNHTDAKINFTTQLKKVWDCA